MRAVDRVGRIVSLSLSLSLSVTSRLVAQVPNPSRSVHPSIAQIEPGTVLHGAAPKLAYREPVAHAIAWNHGEGFAPGGHPDADYGGWFSHDDGTSLTSADVNLWQGQTWSPYTFTNELHPANGTTVSRLQGYLRPAGIALPTDHPRYGNVGSWVDSGAFEIFRPVAAYGNQKVLIVIQCSSTTTFPGAWVAAGAARQKYTWWNTYSGFFSPDGLVRSEFAGSSSTGAPGTPAALAGFLQNTAVADVERLEPDIVASWNSSGNQAVYYPICGYPVLTVMHRQTELNEQRQLQLLQAIKCLMQENTLRNPLRDSAGLPMPLSAQQIEDRVVVVFAGGSNGGTQSSFTTLRHPELVHGCFAQVINSGMERLFGEQDLGWAVSELSGSYLPGATVGPGDFLDWCQYTWNQGLEVHDVSFIRRFFSGATYRPGCFYVGDEDLTSTGTDWIRVADGANWSRSGIRNSTSAFGSTANHTFAWLSAENTDHGAGFAEDPYHLGTSLTPLVGDFVHSLAVHAVNQRAAQLANNQTVPIPALSHQPRTNNQQFRGLDEPHEWYFGRGNENLPAPSPGDPLIRDDAFSAVTQSGAAGTWLGYKESMLIRDNRVYVGSADGVVSSFKVDEIDPHQPLVLEARSDRLGSRAFAMTAVTQSGGGWSLLVGTRRHLYQLHPTTLAILHIVELPWEVAQPHGFKIGDVLPGHQGDELVFRTVHGGLCFYDTNLNPVFEWPEPGIEDFVLRGGTVTILSSRRAVLANVTFDNNNVATLRAVSKPLPLTPTDPPCQGIPRDLESMLINTPWGVIPGLVSFWDSDADKAAVRVHDPATLERVPLPALTDLGRFITAEGSGRGSVDLATCRESGSSPLGDHLLVLMADNLMLFNQYGGLVGKKSLTSLPTGGYYPFGSQA